MNATIRYIAFWLLMTTLCAGSKTFDKSDDYPDVDGLLSVQSAKGRRRASMPMKSSHDRDKPKVTYTYQGNSNRTACVFPFKYKGKTYYDCTTYDDKSGTLWCSTTPDYDVDELWGYCIKTKSYNECQDQRQDCGQLAKQAMCSINSVYAVQNCPRSCGFCTWGGTGNNSVCVFPFIYQNNVFFKCPKAKMEQYRGQIWCGTTDNVDKDDKWGFCYPSLYESILEANMPFLRYDECDDLKDDCRTWVEKGYCMRAHISMDKECPWGCRRCCPIVLLKSKICKDYHSKCSFWSSNGDCIKKPLFMYGMCRLSCRLCATKGIGDTVTDVQDECKRWAAKGECKTNGVFMVENCRRTCATGGYVNNVKYLDKLTHCGQFAKEGYCGLNANMMRETCPYSCNALGGGSSGPSTSGPSTG